MFAASVVQLESHNDSTQESGDTARYIRLAQICSVAVLVVEFLVFLAMIGVLVCDTFLRSRLLQRNSCGRVRKRFLVVDMSTPRAYILNKLASDILCMATYCVMYLLKTTSAVNSQQVYTEARSGKIEGFGIIYIASDFANQICWFHAALMQVLLSRQYCRIVRSPIEARLSPGILISGRSVLWNLAGIWSLSVTGGLFIQFCFIYIEELSFPAGEFLGEFSVGVVTYFVPIGLSAIYTCKAIVSVKKRIVGNTFDGGSSNAAVARKILYLTLLFALCFLPYQAYQIGLALAHWCVGRFEETPDELWELFVGGLVCKLVVFVYFLLYPFVLFCYKRRDVPNRTSLYIAEAITSPFAA